MNCSASRERSASRTSDESSASAVSCRASTARAVAEAGLLSSWASPAAMVPRAISDSRWRDSVSMLRTVWKKPSMRWTLKGNHERTSSPSAEDGSAQHAPGAGAAGGGEVAARRVPRLEAAGPDPRTFHRQHHDGVAPAGPAHEIDASGEQHPPAVGRLALDEEHRPLLEGDLLARRQDLAELAVVEPLEEEQAAQLLDVHQTVAR